MSKKFRAPKCPVCGIQQKASSKTAWEKGNYACRCNSLDYDSIRKQRVIPNIEQCIPLADGETISFVIPGPPAILKNHKQISMRGGRPILIPSVGYLVWASKAFKALDEAWKLMNRATISGPIRANMKFYRESRRRSDLSNLYQGIEDCLQALNIILDDEQIESHDGSRKLYDKDNPRIEITLTRFTEE